MKDNKPAMIATAMLVLFIVASVWLVGEYVSAEKKRDIQGWQERLSVLAESQKRAIENWLNMQLDNLEEVAANPLLQLFLSFESQPDTEITDVERGQIGHLKNLLNAAASRSGEFDRLTEISSNQENELSEGMGILDVEAALKLSTRYFPVKDSNVKDAVNKSITEGKTVVIGIYDNGTGMPRLVMAAPVKKIQTGNQKNQYQGAIVAVINPEKTLYKILAQHWLTTKTDESLLIKGNDSSVLFMSPLGRGYSLFHQVPAENKDNAAVFSLNNIGGFAIRKDYTGEEVLVTSRRINHTDWLLQQKINSSEALSESKAHRDFVFTVFMLVVFILAISFIAIWRHGTSVRLKRISEKLEARTRLLIAVSDNIRDPIFLLDKDNHFVFINKSLATCMKTTDEVKGVPLNHVFDSETSEKLMQLRKDGEVKNNIMELSMSECKATVHVTVVGLTHGKYKESALYVLHDITSLKEAQDKHNRLFEDIISTLVHATDMHDPHCANHSERTREVAVAVAKAMELSDESVNALSMAAQLANIGKLYLPGDILTKMDALTEEEEKILRSNVNETVAILKDLEFDGPVIEIIKQKNEYLDGSGYPEGLKENEILQESKILSAANAFVAMSSARAYRVGKPVQEVLNILLEQSGKRYDRHVIAALFHVAENRSDWSNWQDVQN